MYLDQLRFENKEINADMPNSDIWIEFNIQNSDIHLILLFKLYHFIRLQLMLRENKLTLKMNPNKVYKHKRIHLLIQLHQL